MAIFALGVVGSVEHCMQAVAVPSEIDPSGHEIHLCSPRSMFASVFDCIPGGQTTKIEQSYTANTYGSSVITVGLLICACSSCRKIR